MKRKLWIILTLAALILALGCGGAMAADETIETKSIFGIVNASTLPDNADIVLTADTTIIMDVDKTVSSIRGSHALRLEGEEKLKVLGKNSLERDHAIIVSSFYSSADFYVEGPDYHDALRVQNDITVENAFFVTQAGYYGMYSANGNITLDCANQRPNNHDFGDIPCNTFELYAGNGSVSATGPLRVRGFSKPCIYAKGDISLTGGSISMNSRKATAMQAGGNILLGDSVEISNNFEYTDEADFSVTAPNGSIMIQDGATIVVDTRYGFGAKSITMLGGSLTVNSAQGTGLRALNGNITLNGNVIVKSLDTAIVCRNGAATINGNLKAENTNQYVCISAQNGVTITGGTASTVTSKCIMAIKSGSGDITLGGKLTVYAGNTYDVPSTPYAVYAEEGSITLQNGCDVTVTGKYGIAAHSITMVGGRLATNIQQGVGVRAFTGNISMMGTANLGSDDTVLYAPHGSVQFNGSLVAGSWRNDSAVIVADRDITLIGGNTYVTAREGNQLALRTYGDITLGGYVNIQGSTNNTDGAIPYTVYSKNGTLTVQSGANVVVQGQYGVGAESLIMQGESLSITASGGPAVTADSGVISFEAPLAIQIPTGGTVSGNTIVNTNTVPSYQVVIDKRSYTLQFAAGSYGSGTMNHVMVREGAEYILPPCTFTPQTGYAFVGWKIGSQVYPAGSAVTLTGNTTAIAQWSRNFYTVSFMPGSGTGTMESVRVNVGEQLLVPECGFEAPEHYEFDYWSNAANPIVLPGSTLRVTNDVNLYANWAKVKHTVTFDNGGGFGSMENARIAHGEQLTLPSCEFNPPTDDTYTFDAWRVGTMRLNPGAKVTITEDTTVTAEWKGSKVQIVFDANGGTGTMHAVTVNRGTAFTLPECGFRPPRGRAFKYWTVTYVYGYSKPGSVITVDRDVTVRAVWRQPVISFDANGGTGTMESETLSPYADGLYTLPACGFTPPEHKVFDGWTDYGAAGTTAEIYGDTLLKASWADKMYTVTFNRGTGSGTMSPEQVTSGSVYTFPECTFTPPSGKVFRGWLFSGKVYHAGETITVSGNMQLYAEWQDNPNTVYTLSFDGNGLYGWMSSIRVKTGETVTLPECRYTVPAAKRFRYWIINYVNYNPGDKIAMTQNMTAKANWDTRPMRTITFKSNGLYKGDLPEARQIYDGYSAKEQEPEPLEMDGYIFLGWFTNMTTNEEFLWDFSTPVTSDLTLYCGWASAPPVAHPITVITNGHGSVEMQDINGNPIEEQTKNNWVFLTVTPDPGYVQQSGINWTTASGQTGYSSLNRFTMPDEPVAVTVTFKPVRASFILPSFLTSIEDEAFSGIAATAVVIPGGVTRITGNPFAGSAVTTIYGYPGSAAQTFINSHPGYTFIPIDDEWMAGQ